MSESIKNSGIAGTFLKCAGGGIIGSLSYPLDSITGAVGNLVSFISPEIKPEALTGNFFKEMAENKYDLVVGLDKKGFSKEESLSCEAGALSGEIATLAIPGAAAIKAIKTVETLSKAEKTINAVGKTTLLSETINLGFDLKR